MRLKISVLALITAVTLVVTVSAQTSPDSGSQVSGQVTATAMPSGGMMSMHLENSMDAAPVKGVPFCANISTDHTQSFADGNRIHSSDSSTLCRDSEGRTRRDAGLNLLGAGPEKPASKLVTINDPVAGVRYVLDPDNKVAHKMGLSGPNIAGAARLPDTLPAGGPVMIFRSTGGPAPGDAGPQANVFYKASSDDRQSPPSTESLGDQSINGIHATGTRMTHTIPAGKMGNDKPIVVTSERWYSNDLKATVMTKHDDPWAGELKTEFTSVSTSEPDASLFTIPSDYKVVDDKDGPIRIKIAAPTPPQ